MFLWKLKPEFVNRIFWQNPKFKFVNLEKGLKHFSLFSHSDFFINWKTSRHFQIKTENKDNIFFYQKYFLLSNYKTVEEILENWPNNSYVCFLSSYKFLEQSRNFLELNFEVDNFFSLLNKEKTLKIIGKLARTSLAKFTYYYNNNTLFLSGNVKLEQDLRIDQYKAYVFKTNLSWIYSKNNNKYFYLDNNKIILKEEQDGDIKNNIIRKPLFLNSYQEQKNFSVENVFNIKHITLDFIFLMNYKLGEELNRVKHYLFGDLAENLKTRFAENNFLLIFPFHYLNNQIVFYKRKNANHAGLAWNKFYYSEQLNEFLAETRFDYKYKENKTDKVLVITSENIYFCFKNECIDIQTLKSTSKVFAKDFDFVRNSLGYYTPYFELEDIFNGEKPTGNNYTHNNPNLDAKPEINFERPENLVKGAFFDINSEQIEILLKSILYSFNEKVKKNMLWYDSNVGLSDIPSILKLINTFFKDEFSKFNYSFVSAVEGENTIKKIQGKLSKNTLNEIVVSKIQTTDWKNLANLAILENNNEFIINNLENWDPLLWLNPNFSSYYLITPNVKVKIDLVYYLNTVLEYVYNNINLGIKLFNFSYSELELFDAGYSILKLDNYPLNFVQKYLKNDYIVSNSYVEYLKTNNNSINFQKKQQDINLERTLQDRSFSIFKNVLNFANLIPGVASLKNVGDISGIFGASQILNSGTSIIENFYRQNRGVENSRLAIEKFYVENSDREKINKLDQNILGIETWLENNTLNSGIVFHFSNKEEWYWIGQFLNKFGWKVRNYVRELKLFNSENDININNDFDYVEFESIDFLNVDFEAKDFLVEILTNGIWLIYKEDFSTSLFQNEKRSAIKIGGGDLET